MTEIRCDLFELVTELQVNHDARTLSFLFWTDLPCGTEVVSSARRWYLDADRQRCVWELAGDRLVVSPDAYGDFNGGHGSIDIDVGDRNALKEFEDSLGDFSLGISSPVSPEIVVSLTVGARQRLRTFGKNNANLVGTAVEQAGGIKVVRTTREVVAPMLRELQPLSL